MKIQRAIPPAAAPLGLISLINGLAGILTGRRYVERFETESRKYFNVRHAFAVSSGKAALTVALSTLKGLSPHKNEVIIPAYTCFSVPSAILKAGLKISLCDIDASTFDLDYNVLERLINSNTLCIVPTHLFGIPVDMDRICMIRGNRDIFILEDAAQAMGGGYNGKKLGAIGDIGIFSLGRGKNITCGSGGLIVTNSDKIAAALVREYSVLEEPSKLECILKYMELLTLALFIHPSLYWFPSGLPFLKLGETIFHKDFPVAKLSGMHAALLKGWRKRLDRSNQIRRRNAEFFIENLGFDVPNVPSVNFLRLPFTAKNTQLRDDIAFLSNSEGLGISRMYPSPINEIEEIGSSFEGQSYPAAKWLSERLLTLPTHPLLSSSDRSRIVSALSASVRLHDTVALRKVRVDS